MRENLLKKQPTWGLRRAQGTGQKSATPATLTKVILVLLTMFLIPSAAWGGSYNSGTLDTTNKTWGVWKLSDATYSSPQNDYLSFSGAGTITLTLTRPDNTLELIKSITLEIGGTETPNSTLESAVIGTNNIKELFTNDEINNIRTFQPTVPIEWSGDIVITLQGTNNSGSILGAYVQTVTGYGLSVAGVPVTDDNNTNILGDQNSTVSFTAAGQDTPATLKLKDATINGGIVWNQTSDLVIELTGTNTITPPSTNESDAITTAENLSEKPNLSFTGSGSLAITNDNCFPISKFNTVSLANGLYLKSDNVPGVYWDDSSSWFSSTTGNTPTSLTITSDVYYPIWVVSSDGVYYTQVSGTNKENVFNDNVTPKVSYNSDNNQLTLYKWECATTDGEFAIILGDQESFNIQLWDVNKIGGSGISFAKSDASLALSTDDEHQGSLTIVQDQYNSYSFTNIPDDNITYSKLTRTDNAVTYQASLITVAGVSPDSEGKFSGISGVTFTPATIGVDQSSSTPATLTLNNASITGDIKFNASLTVHLVGDNTITKPENISYAFDLGNTARDLNFSTDETEPGTLKIVGSYSDLQNHGIIYYGQIEGGTYGTGTTGDVIWKQTFSTDATPSYFILSLNKHYNLWKNGHQYHDLILDNNDGYVFNPDPEKPTLTITNSSSSDYINSGLEDLTIIVSGSQSLSHIAFGAPAGTQAEGITTGYLTIKKNETSSATVNELTLANADGGVISGFSSVTIVEPMGVKSQSPSPFTTWEGTHNAVISDAQFYDLWVGGVQVTSGNASNIIGTNEFNDPLAVFDAETSTLTLKDADIMVTEEGGGAVVSGLENLTVKFEGSNFIGYDNLTTFYGFKAQEGKTHNITFTASEDASFMTQAGKENAVFGFNKVTYNDGLVAYMDDGFFNIKKLEPELFFDIENDNNSKPVAISIKTEYEVTLVSHKIAYAIDYADENMADVPETEYTDVIPLATITAGPCTVSAYTLTLDGENTKSNNTDGYYFAYKESELTIGIGATVDLKDYLLPALPEGGVLINSTAESQELISIKEGDYTITGNANGTTVVNSFAEGEDNFTVFNQILESEDFKLKMNVTVKDVISDNTFSSGQSYGTFFNTTEAYNVPEGLTAYIITNVNEEKGTIEMTETSVLPPNTPVLMYRTSTTVSPNYVFTKASNVEPATTKLKYTTTDKPAEESSKLYVLYNGQFVKVTSGTKILANHCYLDLANTSSGTRSYYDIDGSDGTTGIREVKSEGVKGEKWADGTWHDLQGRKFTTKPTKPGLYILNGKKVVIK